MMERCTIPGCSNKRKAKGLCATHYRRLQLHGDVHYKRKSAQRIWIEQNIGCQSQGCLIWPFRCNQDGYAVTTVDHRPAFVSRIVCEMASGSAPEGHNALHSCGNGHNGCVNPEHLYWGTQAQNMADRIAHAIEAGKPASPRAKLSVSDVIEMRRRLAAGETRRSLATEFNVSKAAVHDIASGRSWAFLAEERAA